MSEAATQLDNEIAKLINRYSEESDLTIIDLIAVLEKQKLDWMHMYHKHHDDKSEEKE
jgi:hypothetical protein